MAEQENKTVPVEAVPSTNVFQDMKQRMKKKKEEEEEEQQPDDGRPIKRIKIPVEIEAKFLKSQAFYYVNTFILALNEAMKRRKLSEPCEPINPVIVRAVNVIERLGGWMKEYPLAPEISLSRFGNIAFRGWFDRVASESSSLMKEIVGGECEDWQLLELSTYFKEAFGNRTRIDYGTGHELDFVAWMCCLARYVVVVTVICESYFFAQPLLSYFIHSSQPLLHFLHNHCYTSLTT